jgi:GMP synthase (glutamine-hydrolysing)
MPPQFDGSLPCICIFLMGSPETVDRIFGLFVARLGSTVCCEPVRVAANEKPKKAIQDYAGIVVSGSRQMVTDRLPWSVATGQLLRKVIEQDSTPLLAVCFGHQLLMQEFGALVDYIPRRQFGPRICNVHEALKSDPLFGGFADRSHLRFFVSHSQSALSLPSRATLLISSQVDPYYACRWGPRQWSTQFHPEFRSEVVAKLLEMQRAQLQQEGSDVDALLKETLLPDDGAALLTRFAQLCCREHVLKSHL